MVSFSLLATSCARSSLSFLLVTHLSRDVVDQMTPLSHSSLTARTSASINWNPFSNSSRLQWVLLVGFMYTVLGNRLHVLGNDFSIGRLTCHTRLHCFPGFLCLRASHATLPSPKESPKWTMGPLIKHKLHAPVLMPIAIDLDVIRTYLRLLSDGYATFFTFKNIILNKRNWL